MSTELLQLALYNDVQVILLQTVENTAVILYYLLSQITECDMSHPAQPILMMWFIQIDVDVYKFLMLYLKQNFCSILLNFSAAKCSSSGYSLVCDKVRTRYKFVKSKNLAYRDLEIADHVVTMNQYSGTLISLHCLYGATSISDILGNLNRISCEPEMYCSIGLKLHECNF